MTRQPYDQDAEEQADHLLAEYQAHMDAHRPRLVVPSAMHDGDHAEHIRLHNEMIKAAGGHRQLLINSLLDQAVEARPFLGRRMLKLAYWLQVAADWLEDRAYVPKTDD